MWQRDAEESRRRQRDAADVAADRLEALRNLTYLMRVDMDDRENLRMYLSLMDRVLDGMMDDYRALLKRAS